MGALKAMSGEAIFTSLVMGSMKKQAEGLTPPQIFALLVFIAPTGGAPTVIPGLERSCKGDATYHPAPDGPGWNGWSASVTRASRAPKRPGSLYPTCPSSSSNGP
jgi:hypothetical protein